RRRPGLGGDVDLDDLTPAHELGDRLTRQANGVIPRRSFHSTRRQGRYRHLDTAFSCLGENEGVLHRVHSPVCPRDLLGHTHRVPVMQPALRVRIHDISHSELGATRRAHVPAAGADGYAAAQAAVEAAVEYPAPGTYADALHYSGIPILVRCVAGGSRSK